jgi:hypothetical protein
MIIYVAMKISTTLTLREIVNMVIAVKETHLLSQLEGISKTKIRGVLAVFKHAQLFLTNADEAEIVPLCFNNSIQCFKDLREQHDSFINQWMLLNHLFVPINLKSDIIWHLDIETKSLRLEELKTLEARIKHFFLSGGHIPHKTFPSAETLTSSEPLYSESSSRDLRWIVGTDQTSSRVLPFPPTSLTSSPSPLKFATQALPVQREISGGSAGSNGSGSGAPPYLSWLSTRSSAVEYVQRNSSGGSGTGNDGVGNADGRERSSSYASEGNSVFYDRRSRMNRRLSVSTTPVYYEGTAVSGRSSSAAQPVPHDYQFEPPPVQQPIPSYVETYYDSMVPSSTLSSNDSYNQLPQLSQNDYSTTDFTSYTNECPYSYEEQQPQQQSAQHSRSDQYSLNCDTFYNSHEQRQLVNPMTGLPLLNPPIGGFMNRHYRPNRNKNTSGGVQNTLNTDSSDSSDGLADNRALQNDGKSQL